MSTLDALVALPARLAADEIHVAFVVTIDYDARPHLWIADRNGKPHPITAFRQHDPDKAAESVSAAWSFQDLALAAQYLDGLRAQLSFGSKGFAESHQAALDGIARVQEYRMLNALDAAAKAAKYEADNPHICVCKRRFATRRGLKMHVARASYGSHAIAVAISQ